MKTQVEERNAKLQEDVVVEMDPDIAAAFLCRSDPGGFLLLLTADSPNPPTPRTETTAHSGSFCRSAQPITVSGRFVELPVNDLIVADFPAPLACSSQQNPPLQPLRFHSSS